MSVYALGRVRKHSSGRKPPQAHFYCKPDRYAIHFNTNAIELLDGARHVLVLVDERKRVVALTRTGPDNPDAYTVCYRKRRKDGQGFMQAQIHCKAAFLKLGLQHNLRGCPVERDPHGRLIIDLKRGEEDRG